MRLVLALLAVLGLLLAPMTAAAAHAACGGDRHQAMMDMPMSGMAAMAQAADQKADPCCDPGHAPKPAKHDDMKCMQACAAMCSVTAALGSESIPMPLKPPAAAPPAARIAAMHPHEPSRLERPPRSIA